jgi:putative transposase
LSLCHDPAYASLPPGQIVPRLADQGIYIACEASFYRILHAAREQHHRGRSRRPGVSTPPKGYCATAPNQVWSWDITYLPTRVRGMFFYLYMIVVQKAILSEGCLLAPPVLHSDNGSAQKGFTLRATLENLGVTASYSRPHVSDDNPYSEALFRTVKYRPDYPSQGFDMLDDARVWVKGFVSWYNHDHRHSAIRYVTPSARHEYRDEKLLEMRRRVYEAAKARHPERWSNRTRNWDYIDEVWLNPPADVDTSSKSAKAA